MKITREQLRSIVGEVLQEEKDYQSFFKAMLNFGQYLNIK